MPGFFAAFNFLYTLGFHLILCLNLLFITITLFNRHPWFTWYLSLWFTGQTYIVFIHILSTPTAQHVGIRLCTNHTLHTLAYQVIPTRQDELPSPDYWMSKHDLLVTNILFVDPGLPVYNAHGALENAEEIPALDICIYQSITKPFICPFPCLFTFIWS